MFSSKSRRSDSSDTEVLSWVARRASVADLEVKMGAGGPPGAADKADGLADVNLFAVGHVDAREMGVQRGPTTAVVDDYRVPVALPVLGLDDCAGRRPPGWDRPYCRRSRARSGTGRCRRWGGPGCHTPNQRRRSPASRTTEEEGSQSRRIGQRFPAVREGSIPLDAGAPARPGGPARLRACAALPQVGSAPRSRSISFSISEMSTLSPAISFSISRLARASASIRTWRRSLLRFHSSWSFC